MASSTNLQPLERRHRDTEGGSLTEYERAWSKVYESLLRRGYKLRSRLDPNWVPSWVGTSIPVVLAEDSIRTTQGRKHLIDATCVRTGKLVYIKRIRTGDSESQILAILNAPAVRDDPRNHSVDVLDSFEDEADPNTYYIVMPFLRPLDRPRTWHRVADCVYVVSELLKGLAFMHDLGVAHLDIAEKNVLADSSCLYPRGFHPVYLELLPDISGAAPFSSRPNADTHLRFLYIDFGLSLHLSPDDPAKPRLTTGVLGHYDNVPEKSMTVPYDPFKVDVFCLGQLFQRLFTARYTNVEFLCPLLDSMTAEDPAARPTATDALERWERSGFPAGGSFAWAQRLRARGESLPYSAIMDTFGLLRALPSLVWRRQGRVVAL